MSQDAILSFKGRPRFHRFCGRALIFALNRPDVLPSGDLGVRAGIRDRYALAELPRPGECPALAEIWRPYRSIASWYLWRGADTRLGQGPVIAASETVPNHDPETDPSPSR